MTDRSSAPSRTAALLWFLAAAAMAVAAVLKFRSGEAAWLPLAAAILALAVGVRSFPRSPAAGGNAAMLRTLESGRYRSYSRKKDLRTGKRRNLRTFKSQAAAEKDERAVQYSKRRQV